MLEVGIGDLSTAQQRSHFALWALVKAPLLIGANLEEISEDSLAILKATEVIAINQDELGVAGDIIFKEGPLEIWAGPLANNDRAVVLFNRHIGGEPNPMRVSWEQLGYFNTVSGGQNSGFRASVRDLYAGRDLGVFEGGFETYVGAHDVAVLRVSLLSGRASSSSSSGGGRGLWQALQRLLGRFVCSGRCQQGDPDGVEGEQQAAGVTWRPWHHPAAARVQAQKRAAAAAYSRAAFSQT